MRIIYYLLLLPFSYLPLSLLYTFRFPIVLIVFRVFKYRKSVVRKNLERSFPDKSTFELDKIQKAFEFHFANLLVEGIKNISISKSQLIRRFKFENTELLEDLFRENKSVILVSSHYENWEWLITSLGLHFEHSIFGIGMPLTNDFFNLKLNARRERFGLKVIHSNNYKEELNNSLHPFAVLVLSDQSPAKTENSYWTTFLNQSTGFFFGAEFLANEYKAAVIYLSTQEIQKGYYSCSMELVEIDPEKAKFGEVTEHNVRKLEQQIMKKPEKWLWSHKRWKRTLPEDVEQLTQSQRIRFEKKFR